jgi:hypothetical protein
MNNILTNATIIALLVGVCVFIFNKYINSKTQKHSKSKHSKHSKSKHSKQTKYIKKTKLETLKIPLLIATIVWIGVYCYQQFYRDDAKQIVLIDSKSNLDNLDNLDNLGNLGNLGNLDNIEDKTRMISKGLNIPFDFNDDDLPSVFLRYNE